MQLDYKKLRDALCEVRDNVDDLTFAEMHRATKINNIGRIASGETKNPKFDSWAKLHKEFPDHIPPPSYIDGSESAKPVRLVQKTKGNPGNVIQGERVNVDNTYTEHQALTLAQRELLEKLGDITSEEITVLKMARRKANPEKALDDILTMLLSME